MKKTSEHRMFTPTSSNSSRRYRRKAPVQKDKEQQQPTDTKQQQLKSQHDIKQPQQLKQELHRSDDYRSRPKFRHHKKQQQPVLLKQMLWKAKAVQPTPSNCNEDEEVAFVNGVEAVDTTKRKPSSSESFVAGSSSQETQSGSEDDVVFLRYSDLRPAVQPSTKWRVDKEQQVEIDRENRPVMPSQKVVKTQVGLEKEAVTRRKQRQKYRLKQKQKRAAAKGHKRLQHQQKQENERLPATKEDTGDITQDRENATIGNCYPSTNLTREMDAGLSQLKEVVPFIVVGDVACPVVADSSKQLGGTATGSEVAIVVFRQHVSAVLDRCKEKQVQYRDSFVVESSGFDAASSYDFFKHRFCEIQKTAGIVYYYQNTSVV